ncbi:MAG: thioredoxin domain-containing protein, partial [Saprospiraceae bacterium]|nr:thioredoxin domain-containing protein [Saprospiraceae bacterium]
ADSIHTHLAKALDADTRRAILDPALADALAASVHGLTDREKGGLRGAPKFPNAPFMESLWLSALRTGNADHRDAFVMSLSAMLNGGIYDHVGGGLCRYSTDADWLVPHFEKMLYDNAAMLRHANWAYGSTGNILFRKRIEQTVAWLSREMTVDDGAFASSLDADSEGTEGKFYVWSRAELDTVLGEDDAEFFAEACDI